MTGPGLDPAAEPQGGSGRPAGDLPGRALPFAADEVMDEVVRNTLVLLYEASHTLHPLVLGQAHFLRLFADAARTARDLGRTDLGDYLDGVAGWVQAAAGFGAAGTRFTGSVAGLPRDLAGVDALIALLGTLRSGGHILRPAPGQPPGDTPGRWPGGPPVRPGQGGGERAGASAPSGIGPIGDTLDVLRTVGYLRVRDPDDGADEWHEERAAVAGALARFADARGLRLVRVHEDTPATGARRPGQASVIRAVVTGAAFTVLIPDALHLSTDTGVHSALTGLLTDIGAQVIHVRYDAPDAACRVGSE